MSLDELESRSLENVRRSLIDIPEVFSADTVFGPYDVICPGRAKDRMDLERVVLGIHDISGMEGSMTAIVALIRT